MLSILIPTYNDSCLALAKALQKQVDSISYYKGNTEVEIIIADDCSIDEAIIKENNLINSLSNCRVIKPEHNLGRACIRNFLAENAKGEWLLFIDGDLKIKGDSYLNNYINAIESNIKVVYGGYSIDGNAEELKGNLRYKVERAAEAKKTIEARKQHPYNHFHTANFLINSETFHSIRFNENMKFYGFEDVLFGKQLKEAGIEIKHIDNPVYFTDFESNAEYLRKTEESIKTQQLFENLIGDYSTLIRTYRKINKLHLSWILPALFNLLGSKLKANILGNNPSIFAFNLYKLLLFSKK